MKARSVFILQLIIPASFLLVALVLLFATPVFAQSYKFDDAVSAYKAGNYKKALEICQVLPYSSKKDMLRGYVYLNKGMPEVAVEYFKKVIINNRFYLLVDHARLGMLKGYYHTGDYQKTLEKGVEFIIDNPDSPVIPEAMLLMGKTYFKLEKYDKAAQIFKKVIDDPNSFFLRVDAQYHLAGCFEQTGETKEATSLYTEIEETSPEDEYAKKSAERLGKIGKPKEGLSYKEAAQDLYDQAMDSFNARHYGPARSTFKKIMNEYGKSGLYDDALLMIARCDYRMRKYSSAKKIFRQVVHLEGDAADDAQFYIAFVYGRQGDLDRAIRAFQAVVKYFPNSELADDAQYYTGYYYEINNEWKKALSAYKYFLANFDKSDLLDDIAFKIGMIQYKNGLYATALQTFRRGHQELDPDDMTAACLFWHGKCEQKVGNHEEANKLFHELSKTYDHTYYAHRARQILVERGEKPKMPDLGNYRVYFPTYNPKRDKNEIATLIRVWQEARNREKVVADEQLEKKEHSDRYHQLMELGQYQYAAVEMVNDNPIFDQKTVSHIGVMLGQAGEYKAPVRHFETVIKRATKNKTAKNLPPESWMAAYPLAYWQSVTKQAKAYNVDPYMVLAIMREESRFAPDVTSRAYARGLMQIIRSTGRSIAKALKLNNYYTNKLYDPGLNIQMGTYYYSTVLKRFDGNHALALAGYNGGPAKVSRWKKEHIKEKGELDIDEFIEHIPYRETRYYVKKVLNSYYEYKRIYERQG